MLALTLVLRQLLDGAVVVTPVPGCAHSEISGPGTGQAFRAPLTRTHASQAVTTTRAVALNPRHTQVLAATATQRMERC